MSTPLNTQIKPTASPAPLNLSAISSAPETPIPTTEQTNIPAPTPLPPASLFTFLPDLYVLISRLSEIRNPPSDLGSTGDGLTQIMSRESNASVSLRQVNSSEATIETRELPGYVFGIKRRIAEARGVVGGLDGVGLTVEEQEGEMEVLRGRIEGVKGRLRELGGICGVEEERDVVMEGVEG